MKNVRFSTAAAIVLSVFLSIPAHALLIIDLEGETSDGFAFNVFSVDNANTAAVTSFDFSFSFDAGPGGNGTGADELIVELGHIPTSEFYQIGTQSGSCGFFGLNCEFDLMAPSASGLFTISGSFLPDPLAPILDGSGEWQIIIASSIDNPGIDGSFLSGSFLRINQAGDGAVPAPGVAWLFFAAFAAARVSRLLRAPDQARDGDRG